MFGRLGVDDLITVTHKDVCATDKDQLSTGFHDIDGVEDKSIDAVFLDLPEPWLALERAYKVLKANGRICCYSPCIEQVTKTCEKIRSMNFHTLRTFEVRHRQYDARVVNMEELDFGLDLEKSDMRDAYIEKQKNRFNRESVFHDDSNLDDKVSDTDTSTLEKRKCVDVHGLEQPGDKKSRVESDANNVSADYIGDEISLCPTADQIISEVGKGQHWSSSANKDSKKSISVARTTNFMKGHTAFLSFAIKSPDETSC